MYKERYEEFQSTISKSNDMFQKFKTEMDKVWLKYVQNYRVQQIYKMSLKFR